MHFLFPLTDPSKYISMKSQPLTVLNEVTYHRVDFVHSSELKTHHVSGTSPEVGNSCARLVQKLVIAVPIGSTEVPFHANIITLLSLIGSFLVVNKEQMAKSIK